MVRFPLSTKLVDYGQYFQVKGDYGDMFLIRVSWDGSVLVYLVGEELTELWEYASLQDCIKAVPGFEIMNPSLMHEKYMSMKQSIVSLSRF